jgi:beta-galactosidase
MLAGVEFDIYEMPTSPVPQVLMLSGRNVPGKLPAQISDVPVNTKADALFFLHTARLDARMDDRQRREDKRFVLFKYVVTYVDGQKVEIPVQAEIDIEHYVQKAPRAIPGAQLAWTRPYDNSDEQAVAYAKQWNNPRPDIEIKSFDMIPVDASRGVPVLLAVTAVQVK